MMTAQDNLIINTSDLTHEIGTNFIEYAVAVNTDRAIPDAKSGLKPVAKRILYCAYDEGYSNSKPHQKCAAIVGDVMGKYHPHGDSSIYGALVRLAQPWVMRYPLIDFHGSYGNQGGDGPAAHRYTEARLAKLAEDGMLQGLKKNAVDFIPNYSETKDEPVTLPSIFPNLLCNPNAGIGVAMACSWAPHNLNEVAHAIFDYINGKEPMLPGPDFPTGGIVINKDDIPAIMRTGHGSVKVRGKYKMEGNNIVFYELPYGITTEALLDEIGKCCDDGDIEGVTDVRNESNRKNGLRVVIECAKDANIHKIIALLFKNTDLQTTFSYNQVALIDKTPTELTLKDCCKIYVEHTTECIRRETEYDLEKTKIKLEISMGLRRALEHIDEIIKLIKTSENTSAAQKDLIMTFKFTELQAKAIVDMKLGKLSRLGLEEIDGDISGYQQDIDHFIDILGHLTGELCNRLNALVVKYGDERRTELTQIAEATTKEEKIIEAIPPEKCIVILTETGNIKRIPATSIIPQHKGGKGVKTQNDVVTAIIRTNTVDSLMIFTNAGKMYRLIVDNIPVGTNTTSGVPVASLIEMEPGEKVETIYSIYRDTDAKYVLFVSKNGVVKKSALSEYTGTKKSKGIGAVSIRDDDKLAVVTLINEEPLLILTKLGYCIKFNSTEISTTARMTTGVKGINLNDGDEVIAVLPIRNSNDTLALFTTNGFGKKIKLSELVLQKRGGKGVVVMKPSAGTGNMAAAQLVSDEDAILLTGMKHSICIKATELPLLSRISLGNSIIKGDIISSASKV
jgi:DNA gyrase subunit A